MQLKRIVAISCVLFLTIAPVLLAQRNPSRDPSPSSSPPNQPGPSPNVPRDPNAPRRPLGESINFQNMIEQYDSRPVPGIEDPPQAQREKILRELLQLVDEKLKSQVAQTLKDSVGIDADALKTPADKPSDEAAKAGSSALARLKKLRNPNTPPEEPQPSNDPQSDDDALVELPADQLVQIQSLLNDAADTSAGRRVYEPIVLRKRIDKASPYFHPKGFQIISAGNDKAGGTGIPNDRFQLPTRSLPQVWMTVGFFETTDDSTNPENKSGPDQFFGHRSSRNGNESAIESIELAHEGFERGQQASSSERFGKTIYLGSAGGGTWSLPEIGDAVLLGFTPGDLSSIEPTGLENPNLAFYLPASNNGQGYNPETISRTMSVRSSSDSAQRHTQFVQLTTQLMNELHPGNRSLRDLFSANGESVESGDVLLERWQRSGIGHVARIDSFSLKQQVLEQGNHRFNGEYFVTGATHQYDKVEVHGWDPVKKEQVVGEAGSTHDRRGQSLYFPESMLQEIRQPASGNKYPENMKHEVREHVSLLPGLAMRMQGTQTHAVTKDEKITIHGQRTEMPPASLPGGKMVSGLKSNSTPGGGAQNETRVWKSRSGHILNSQSSAVAQPSTANWGTISLSGHLIKDRNSIGAPGRNTLVQPLDEVRQQTSIFQRNESDMAFLKRLASRNGYQTSASSSSSHGFYDALISEMTLPAMDAKLQPSSFDVVRTPGPPAPPVPFPFPNAASSNPQAAFGGPDPKSAFGFDVKLEGKNALKSMPLMGHEVAHAVQNRGGTHSTGQSGASDDNASRWIRVMQPPLGGNMVVPSQTKMLILAPASNQSNSGVNRSLKTGAPLLETKTIIGGFKSMSGMDSETESFFKSVSGLKSESEAVDGAGGYPTIPRFRRDAETGNDEPPDPFGTVDGVRVPDPVETNEASPPGVPIPYPNLGTSSSSSSASGDLNQPVIIGSLWNGSPKGDAPSQKAQSSPFEVIQASYSAAASAQISPTEDSTIRGYDRSHRLNRGTK